MFQPDKYKFVSYYPTRVVFVEDEFDYFEPPAMVAGQRAFSEGSLANPKMMKKVQSMPKLLPSDYIEAFQRDSLASFWFPFDEYGAVIPGTFIRRSTSNDVQEESEDEFDGDDDVFYPDMPARNQLFFPQALCNNESADKQFWFPGDVYDKVPPTNQLMYPNVAVTPTMLARGVQAQNARMAKVPASTESFDQSVELLTLINNSRFELLIDFGNITYSGANSVQPVTVLPPWKELAVYLMGCQSDVTYCAGLRVFQKPSTVSSGGSRLTVSRKFLSRKLNLTDVTFEPRMDFERNGGAVDAVAQSSSAAPTRKFDNLLRLKLVAPNQLAIITYETFGDRPAFPRLHTRVQIPGSPKILTLARGNARDVFNVPTMHRDFQLCLPPANMIELSESEEDDSSNIEINEAKPSESVAAPEVSSSPQTSVLEGKPKVTDALFLDIDDSTPPTSSNSSTTATLSADQSTVQKLVGVISDSPDQQDQSTACAPPNEVISLPPAQRFVVESVAISKEAGDTVGAKVALQEASDTSSLAEQATAVWDTPDDTPPTSRNGWNQDCPKGLSPAKKEELEAADIRMREYLREKEQKIEADKESSQFSEPKVLTQSTSIAGSSDTPVKTGNSSSEAVMADGRPSPGKSTIGRFLSNVILSRRNSKRDVNADSKLKEQPKLARSKSVVVVVKTPKEERQRKGRSWPGLLSIFCMASPKSSAKNSSKKLSKNSCKDSSKSRATDIVSAASPSKGKQCSIPTEKDEVDFSGMKTLEFAGQEAQTASIQASNVTKVPTEENNSQRDDEQPADGDRSSPKFLSVFDSVLTSASSGTDGNSIASIAQNVSQPNAVQYPKDLKKRELSPARKEDLEVAERKMQEFLRAKRERENRSKCTTMDSFASAFSQSTNASTIALVASPKASRFTTSPGVVHSGNLATAEPPVAAPNTNSELGFHSESAIEEQAAIRFKTAQIVKTYSEVSVPIATSPPVPSSLKVDETSIVVMVPNEKVLSPAKKEELEAAEKKMQEFLRAKEQQKESTVVQCKPDPIVSRLVFEEDNGVPESEPSPRALNAQKSTPDVGDIQSDERLSIAGSTNSPPEAQQCAQLPTVPFPYTLKDLETGLSQIFFPNKKPVGFPGFPAYGKRLPINEAPASSPVFDQAATFGFEVEGIQVQEHLENLLKENPQLQATSPASIVSPTQPLSPSSINLFHVRSPKKPCLSKPDLFANVPEYFDHAKTACSSPATGLPFDKDVRPSPPRINREMKKARSYIHLVFPKQPKKMVKWPSDNKLVSDKKSFDEVLTAGGSGFRIISVRDKAANRIDFPGYTPPESQ